MGQITSYSAISKPVATDDLLFIADTSASYQIKKIDFQTLHSVAKVQGAGAGGNLSLADGDGDVAITILDGGKVGIGIAVPTRLLQLYNNTATVADQAQLRITNAGAGDSYIYFDAGSDWSAGIDNSDSDKFKIGPSNDVSDGSETLTLQTDGNVGIGESSPADLLVVSGDASYIRTNFSSTNSLSGVKFTENDTTKARILYVGSLHATSARRSQLEIRGTSGCRCGD